MTRTGTTVAAAIVALVAFAAAGNARTTGAPSIKVSTVKLTTSGFDFGGRVLVAGAPTSSGELSWEYDDGTVTPRLDGYLHLSDVWGSCARMRLDYYGGAHVKLATKYGGTVCAGDDGHHVWRVSLRPYGSRKINEVTVSLEKQAVSGGWSVAGSQTLKLNPAMSNGVSVRAEGFDFGGAGFALGTAIGTGAVTWNVEDAELVPRLTGTLHLYRVAGACARMRLAYFGVGGERETARSGQKRCAPDNRHHAWDVSLGPYGSTSLSYVEVQLQTLGADGVWRRVGGWGPYSNIGTAG